jgi:hypothetical protein
MKHRVVILVVVLVAFMSMLACLCSGAGESAEDVALRFAKAVFEERDVAEANQMGCPEYHEKLYMPDLSQLGDNLEVTNIKMVYATKQDVTAADEANGITGRVKVRVGFAYRSNKTSGKYKDREVSIFMLKRQGGWCVGGIGILDW